jgi:hypothetical protein
MTHIIRRWCGTPGSSSSTHTPSPPLRGRMLPPHRRTLTNQVCHVYALMLKKSWIPSLMLFTSNNCASRSYSCTSSMPDRQHRWRAPRRHLRAAEQFTAVGLPRPYIGICCGLWACCPAASAPRLSYLLPLDAAAPSAASPRGSSSGAPARAQQLLSGAL